MSRTHRASRTALALLAAVLLVAVGARTGTGRAAAATPGEATLSLAGQKSVTWQSPVYAEGNFGGPSGCPADDPENKECDHFFLTVDVPDSYWDDNPEGGIPVSIRWERPVEDFDLYILDSAGKQVASSAGTADPEATVIPRAHGTYHLVVVPYDVHDNSYTGTAYLPEPTDVGNLTGFSANNGVYEFAAGESKGKAEFTAPDQFRLRFAPDGVFTDPAGTKIVRTTPPTLRSTRSWDAGTYYAVASDKAVLRIYKTPLRFALYEGDNSTPIFEEDKGLRWTQGGLRQSLRRGATEQFFGGGEQNGAFSHRGKLINVANSFNWNEGGYNNSQPFLPVHRRVRRVPQHVRAGAVQLRRPGAHRRAGEAPGRVLLRRRQQEGDRRLHRAGRQAVHAAGVRPRDRRLGLLPAQREPR